MINQEMVQFDKLSHMVDELLKEHEPIKPGMKSGKCEVEMSRYGEDGSTGYAKEDLFDEINEFLERHIGTDALYHSRTGALNDNKILELLRELPNMYENGEIIEVRDVCLDVCNAIEDFCDSYDQNDTIIKGGEVG